jgi:hypothetical protein
MSDLGVCERFVRHRQPLPDIAITANVYGHVLPQTAQASSERRARMLAGTPALADAAS